MTVNLVLASPSMDITCYFANIHRILVKVEQRFFHRQMTLGHIRLLTASCEGGRPKLSHSDAPGQSDWGSRRANPYVPYGIVCLNRYLLSHLQIPIFYGKILTLCQNNAIVHLVTQCQRKKQYICGCGDSFNTCSRKEQWSWVKKY